LFSPSVIAGALHSEFKGIDPLMWRRMVRDHVAEFEEW
jgi:hypothetical protein